MAEAREQLQAKLKYEFQDPSLLLMALTHPSYSAEHPDSPHNQRLEFLGDAVIEMIVTHRLYEQFPSSSEGRLTKIRAAITRADSLAEFARQLGLGACLRLGHGEERNGGRERQSTLCDAFEALVAAVYLDSGQAMDVAGTIVNALVDRSFCDLHALSERDNPKGALQEWSQKHLQQNPHYELVDTMGPDHDKTYTVAVVLDNEQLGRGTASRRQTAEMEAARQALNQLQRRAGEDAE